MNHANFFTEEDVLDRYYFNYRYFKYITLSNKTKNIHNISGWMCIVGILQDKEIPLYDVYTGNNNQYLKSILKTMFLAGLKLDVLIKIPKKIKNSSVFT
jgi:hypothetical protein